MATRMENSAQERIVDDISRDRFYRERLENRLKRYPILGKLCSGKSLRGQPPYYCHALTFRMAVWSGEDLFKRLEKLLAKGASVPGFAQERRQISGNLSNYQRIFEFIWPLQVVEFLADRSMEVKFQQNGPDLVVTPFGELSRPFFVECYFYNKHWGIEQFISDILLARFPDFELRRRPCPSPAANKVEAMINLLLSPFAEKALDAKPGAVVSAWPSQVEPDWAIVRRGRTTGIKNAQRDRQVSYQHFLQESVRNKARSNGLRDNRPNLLAVNALGLDFQFATSSWPNNMFPYINLPETIDGVWWNSCGYDAPLGMKHGRYMLRSLDHPFRLTVPAVDG